MTEAALPRQEDDRARDDYIPLFWRIFVPNATVLTVAGVVLAAEPANGRVVVIGVGLAVMLAVNLVIMRRSFSPIARLAETMSRIDPLRPGQRVAAPGPQSEVTLVATAFNRMLDRLEHERRESARRELSAQQAERTNVARELHDELGQNLTALALHLDRIATGAVEDPAHAAAAARDAAIEAVDNVRRLARKLRPDILDELGLQAALGDLCHRLEEQTGLDIELTTGGIAERLDPDCELVIYRVVQESLTNVIRHAGAGRARVSVDGDAGDLVVTVEDDGQGLAAPVDAHVGGILQMRERALLIGGRLDVGSAPSGGTRVVLRAPGLLS